MPSTIQIAQGDGKLLTDPGYLSKYNNQFNDGGGRLVIQFPDVANVVSTLVNFASDVANASQKNIQSTVVGNTVSFDFAKIPQDPNAHFAPLALVVFPALEFLGGVIARFLLVAALVALLGLITWVLLKKLLPAVADIIGGLFSPTVLPFTIIGGGLAIAMVLLLLDSDGDKRNSPVVVITGGGNSNAN